MNNQRLISKIGHVYIPTSNLEKAIKWYTSHLDFKLINTFIDRGNSLVAVLHSPAKHAVAVLLVESTDTKRLEITREEQAFPVLALYCPDIEYTHSYLKSKNVQAGDIQVLGENEAKYFYFRDCDNNLLEGAWSVWDPVEEY
jgi:catechol 2,3-dioxygenase-like lactoylglutathione lyase family enzyme